MDAAMKFGKKFKLAHEAGWVYLDYKGLKSSLKRVRKCPIKSPMLRAAEHGFQEDLWNEIAQVPRVQGLVSPEGLAAKACCQPRRR